MNCCFRIHSKRGPGLLESAYEEFLVYELSKAKLKFIWPVAIPVEYEAVRLYIGFGADIIIEAKVIVELKSIETIMPVHKKQLLTYLKITGLKLGLLVNFNENLIKNGISRVVNNL